jgi:cytochrome c biogenesis protein CcmG/thiol:disulfide interchange protein DsbE
VTETATPPARRRPRTALWISVVLAVVLALLVGVLATRKSATDRLVDSPLVGKGVPALTGTTVRGTSYDIDDHQGEWVVVNFFATWCVPCQQEHDDLARFAKFHEADGDASVVSVVFDDTPARVKQYFAQRGGTWPVVRDDGALATAFGVARVPESYLVAPNGVVVAKITGGVTYDFLQEQLAKFGSAQG